MFRNLTIKTHSGQELHRAALNELKFDHLSALISGHRPLKPVGILTTHHINKILGSVPRNGPVKHLKTTGIGNKMSRNQGELNSFNYPPH